jgi:GH15 family glucan-1,4-alpha-glucosidase
MDYGQLDNHHHSSDVVGENSSLPVMSEIQDYGIIGDCRAAALVSRYGSIDWLCWPRFDKDSIFAALLDPKRGGYWSICLETPQQIDRQYLRESNVLQTKYSTSSGAATLTDLMPVIDETSTPRTMITDHEIIREVECTAGEIVIDFSFLPRAEYGLKSVHIRDAGKLGFRMEVGGGVYWLRSSVSLQLRSEGAYARIPMKRGDSIRFSFSYAEDAPAVLPPLDKAIIAARVRATVAWWQQWAKRAQYDGPYRDEVVRSALALKLLSYAPSGAIIAAPTTSLPERIGGDLNWDYRYCWLRDASLTIRTMLGLGYWEEADDFMDWMLHATRVTQPELRVAYTVYGELAPRERVLDLAGYKGSRPVRIGNAARDQFQLDVYGEVIDAASQYAFHGRELDRTMQNILTGFGNYVVKHWMLPDEGLWEPRTGREHHTHSRLLCWTALDRLISLHQQGMLSLLGTAQLDVYKQNSELIRREIQQRGWNQQLQTYVSVLDGDQLDASLLLLSWYGFEKAGSPRMQTTHRAIMESLATDGLLYRYRTEPSEGAFAICSFWEAEYLALGGGSLAQSHAMFRRLLTYRNDLGLYGEEIDPQTGAALGNFPQGFTHVGLIGAALSIAEREKGEPQLAHREETATKRSSKEEAPA